MATLNEQASNHVASSYIPVCCGTCDHQCANKENYAGDKDHVGSCLNWANQGFLTTFSQAIEYFFARALIKEEDTK